MATHKRLENDMEENILRTYYDIIVRAWKMFKTDAELPPSVKICPESDRAWGELLEKYSTDLAEQYKGTPYLDFACGIANTMLMEIERIAKRKEGMKV